MLVDKVTGNYQYSRSNKHNLQLPVQMQSSEKLKIFSRFWIEFLESALNFEHFKKKKQPDGSSISDINDSQRRVYVNAQKVFFVKTLSQ